MRIPGLKTLRQSARWLRSRLYGRALILGYHRVAEPHDDPYQLCVSPGHFAAQMAVLQQKAAVLPLAELRHRLDCGSLPPCAVAITFDDGYLDNLECALPILEQHHIPATMFINTGSLGQPPWWEMLAQRVPSDSDRLQTINRLYDELLPLAEPARRTALAALARETPHDIRLMDEVELQRLAANPLVEIGAHTVSHPRLTDLPLDAQRDEIAGSKQALEHILGLRITGFSYPHGAYSADTLQIVRDAGFTYACTSVNDTVRAHTDRRALPRFWIPNVNGDRFATWLQRWLTH